MALIYYLKSKNKDGDCISETVPEKIVYASPPHHHGYKYVEPSGSHYHKYESHQPPDYHPDESQTQKTHEAPPNTYEERYGIAPKYNTKPYSSKNTYNPYVLKYSTINPVKLNDHLSIRGGRSVRSTDGKIDEKINKIADFIMRYAKQ
ncbi:uncharacterized protein LOC108733997 [Agrilus planipennis]|uniref:Uncharacterized protein LOC108733997 n=1 Tax=Agrilus planipennis TaxID=224129 RepID=A0A1W4WA55_AGRPL|nr:uncharacterized protein LOC108733997 [Agrilus planipennis]